MFKAADIKGAIVRVKDIICLLKKRGQSALATYRSRVRTLEQTRAIVEGSSRVKFRDKKQEILGHLLALSKQIGFDSVNRQRSTYIVGFQCTDLHLEHEMSSTKEPKMEALSRKCIQPINIAIQGLEISRLMRNDHADINCVVIHQVHRINLLPLNCM